MLANTVESHRDVFWRDADDSGNLVVADVFEPKQYDGTVERLQLADAAVQQSGLLCVAAAVVEEVDVHRELGFASSLLFLVDGDACVECNAVNPRLYVAASVEGVDAFPKADKHLLEKVGDFLFVAGEHVAHGVDGAFVLFHHVGEFLFVRVHCYCFRCFFVG